MCTVNLEFFCVVEVAKNIGLLRGCDQNVEMTWKSFPVDSLKHRIEKENNSDISEMGVAVVRPLPHPTSPVLGHPIIEE